MTKISLIYEFNDETELRAHLDGNTRAVPAANPALTTTLAAIAAEPTINAEPADIVRNASDVDGDGMPYDAAVHADPPSTTKDGLWRAKRGYSEQANAARAAFKARGGNVQPPPDPVVAAPAAPALPPVVAAPAAPALPPVVAAPAAPALPPVVAAPAAPALPPSMPEPVDIQRLYEAITAGLKQGKIDSRALYVEFCKTDNPAEVGALLNTDETMRRAMFDRIVAQGVTL